MSNEERLRTLLSDLGKATLRGVRKCPKCGTYNGSRGLCCKNKYCDAVFKEPGEKRKLSTEACKLITGSIAQVFSVRVRDKGPDFRGFVQLPLINATISNDITTLISQTTTLCFVDSCERSFDASVLKCHEKDTADMSISTCQHIQAALRCYAEAQPLTLRNSILSSLNVNNETKQEIWLLATETSGPLVQRVSKNIMVVKCKASPKHPLGYLHFSFFITKLKDRVEHRYFCSCTAFKTTSKMLGDKIETTSAAQVKRCVHFYACICAFASDPKLSEEFEYYINLDQADFSIQKPLSTSFQTNETDKIVGMDLESLTTDDTDTHLLIFRDDTLTVQNLDGSKLDMDSMNLDSAMLPHGIVENIEVECDRTLLDDTNIISQVHNLEVIDQNVVLDANAVKILDNQSTIDTKYNVINDSQYLLDDSNIKILNSSGTVKILDANTVLDANNVKLLESSTLIDGNTVKIIDGNTIIQCDCGIAPNVNSIATTLPTSSAKRKRDEKLGRAPNTTSLNNLNSIEPRKAKTKPTIIKKYQNTCENLDEANTSLSFIKWLASITERINQTMHFQFDGKPDPLVFHVPQIFFDCLRERISCGGKKKRLPNSTTAFVRKDGVPLGTFTKYTWHITNILHVKSIFETPIIPLEITRSFVQNADGTYELYKREETDIDRFKKTSNNALIKPLELKTYLKVGNTSPNQVEPTPFLIEWIPDILPISKIGELRIRFEFGHVKNETPQRWRKVAVTKSYY
ncbi:uncharacterized protein C2orf42 isoform X2 [Cephus cinctus]|nr:uncharacterized protein C2orf42 isoform X2 [Cephus cinctus]XP_015585460.1 uncharacterized protein C2orf42 isoform X2 [Cephus cinctus]XP_024936272.1 uncharacterized protein C2orf42 isoform X2 [Cephus cinctus]